MNDLGVIPNPFNLSVFHFYSRHQGQISFDAVYSERPNRMSRGISDAIFPSSEQDWARHRNWISTRGPTGDTLNCSDGTSRSPNRVPKSGRRLDCIQGLQSRVPSEMPPAAATTPRPAWDPICFRPIYPDINTPQCEVSADLRIGHPVAIVQIISVARERSTAEPQSPRMSNEKRNASTIERLRDARRFALSEVEAALTLPLFHCVGLDIIGMNMHGMSSKFGVKWRGELQRRASGLPSSRGRRSKINVNFSGISGVSQGGEDTCTACVQGEDIA
jgi:hypothetical protein